MILNGGVRELVGREDLDRELVEAVDEAVDEAMDEAGGHARALGGRCAMLRKRWQLPADRAAVGHVAADVVLAGAEDHERPIARRVTIAAQSDGA